MRLRFGVGEEIETCMAAKKEAVVCILDVSKHMGSGSSGGDTHLQSAKAAIEMFVQQKLLFKPKDEVCLVLVGCDSTSNPLADENPGCYQNVSIARPLGPPDLNLLRQVDAVKPGKGEGDVLDAIIVSLQVLHPFTKHNCRIFLVTDARSTSKDTDQASDVAEMFKNMSCKLDVIGIDFNIDASEKSDQKKVNERLLQSIISEGVSGQVVSVHKALEIMGQLRTRSVSSTSKMRGELDIAGVIRIPVWTFGKTVEQKMPSMKKMSTAGDGGGDVGMDRQYRSATDLTREVAKEDRVKAFKYGKEQFPISAEDDAALKYDCDRCLTVLGFCHMDSIPRNEFMAGVDCVVPAPDDRVASMALSALVHALGNTGRVAIVRYVKRANSVPTLGVLTPYNAKAGGAPDMGEGGHPFDCLFLNALPFCEDVRTYEFAPLGLAPHKPSADQLQAAGDLIDSLDLMTADEGPDGEPCEALRPVDTFNPVLQRFYTSLAARAMAEGCPLPPLTPLVQKTVNPDETLLSKAEGAIKGFQSAFNLKPNVKAAAKKRKFWGDAAGGAGAPAGGGSAGAGAGAGAAGVAAEEAVVSKPDVDAAARKRNKGNQAAGDADLNLSDLFNSGPVSAVGSADPIGNFNAMLARRDGDFVKTAVVGMQQQIERLLTEGSALFLGKALDCLKALRAGCIANFEAEDFNAFMHKLKDAHDRTAFWEQVQAAHTTLISNEDSDDVDVTKEEADAFLATSAAPVVVAAPVAPPPAPAASLYDDME